MFLPPAPVFQVDACWRRRKTAETRAEDYSVPRSYFQLRGVINEIFLRALLSTVLNVRAKFNAKSRAFAFGLPRGSPRNEFSQVAQRVLRSPFIELRMRLLEWESSVTKTEHRATNHAPTSCWLLPAHCRLSSSRTPNTEQRITLTPAKRALHALPQRSIIRIEFRVLLAHDEFSLWRYYRQHGIFTEPVNDV